MKTQNQHSGKPNALPCVQTPVSGSISSLTEKRFRDFFTSLPNGCYRYQNGKQIYIYTIYCKIDNNFYLSYHLKFNEKNIQFNFWFDKISYINSKESVSIAWHNKDFNHINDGNLILYIDSFVELKKKVDELFLLYK